MSYYSPSTLFFILLIMIFTANAQPATPQPSSPVNLTDILIKGREYNALIGFLNATQVNTQLTNMLRAMNSTSSSSGLTLFAPTDDAFAAFRTTMFDLHLQQKVNLLLYHVLPRFYALQDFRNITNVMTLASNNGTVPGYTLNFTTGSGGDEVSVSTGVVETRLDSELSSRRPLAVFKVDKVLLPPAILLAASPPLPGAGHPRNTSSGGDVTTKFYGAALSFLLAASCVLI